jgi:hypothetical protein
MDVTGLSAEAIHIVESLVSVLRSKTNAPSPNVRDPQAWSKALREWAASHEVRNIVIDDSRERIYEGRGE